MLKSLSIIMSATRIFSHAHTQTHCSTLSRQENKTKQKTKFTAAKICLSSQHPSAYPFVVIFFRDGWLTGVLGASAATGASGRQWASGTGRDDHLEAGHSILEGGQDSSCSSCLIAAAAVGLLPWRGGRPVVPARGPASARGGAPERGEPGARLAPERPGPGCGGPVAPVGSPGRARAAAACLACHRLWDHEEASCPGSSPCLEACCASWSWCSRPMACRRGQRGAFADRLDHPVHLVQRLEHRCLGCRCRRLELELLVELGTHSRPLGER